MGSGKEGTPHTCYATFNRWNDERNVNVNRNDNDWNDTWSFAGVPKLSSFLAPQFRGAEFYLFSACRWTSCPCQPPSILPISSTGPESAAYFLLSNDLLSHRTSNRSFIVSNLLMVLRRYGSFSVFGKNAAAEIFSITSTNNTSTFAPTVY